MIEREYDLLGAGHQCRHPQAPAPQAWSWLGPGIGTDAHTVGIDAILNIKGFAGEKGLEYYREMTVHNLGAQVLIPDLGFNTARGACAPMRSWSLRSSPRKTPTSTTPPR